MADDLKRVGLTFKADGTVDFKKTLAEVNAAVKENYSSFRLAQSQWDKSTTSQEKLKAKQEYLTKQTEVYSDKVKVLKDKLEQLEKAEERDGQAIEKTKSQINGAQATLNNYQKELEDVNKELKNNIASLNEFSEKLGKVGEKTTDAGKKLTSTVTAGVVGIGVASVKTAADFESSMSKVAATMGMTADEINNGSDDFKKLEETARKMGSETMFSATDAAEALNYLALAGYDVDKSINTLPTVLNLAAAGEIDLASASDMVTDAMSALGDTAGSTEEFVDKMAVTAQKSNTSVAQLGEAILTVGGTAKNLAGGTTELNTALGILADNGVKGAEGGTALRNIILSLSAPTETAANQMEALGLQVYDAEGKMRPLNDIFNDLNLIMSTMTQGEQTEVLNKIFNKVDLKSANALLANSGDRFNELSGYINDCDGAAANMAETMQNNLNGQITELKSALSEAGIAIGQELIPIIKDIVEDIKEWVDWFNKLDEGQKKTIITIIAVVAAIGPLLIIIGTLCSSISNIITLFTTLAPVIGAINAPIVIIIAAIAALIAIGVLLYKNWDKIKEGASKVWDGVKLAFNTGISFAKTLVNGFISFVTSIPKKVVDIFKGIGSTIKGIFNFVIDLPKIKLPHFNVTPKGWKIGDLLSGTIPKLGINWYAKGGILNKPTIFGQSGDKLLGGGEAGQEAVLPISLLKEYIDTANQVSEERLLSVLTTVLGKTMTEAILKALKLYAPEITLDGEVIGELLSKWFREEVIA